MQIAQLFVTSLYLSLYMYTSLFVSSLFGLFGLYYLSLSLVSSRRAVHCLMDVLQLCMLYTYRIMIFLARLAILPPS